MFQNLKWDYNREYKKCGYKGKIRKTFFSLGAQGFQAVWGYRMCRWLVTRRIPVIHIFIQRSVEIGTGVSISPLAKIGRGLKINHFGGIVINMGTEIGEFCTISQGVTIGNKHPGGKSPKIGNNVYVSVDAKILGDIEIGDNSIIGASAVVTKSIPANSIVAGIPGRVIRNFDPETECKEFRYEN